MAYLSELIRKVSDIGVGVFVICDSGGMNDVESRAWRIDWQVLIPLLRRCGYSGPLLYE